MKFFDFCEAFIYVILSLFIFLLSTQVQLSSQSKQTPNQKLLFLIKHQECLWSLISRLWLLKIFKIN